VLEEAMRGAEDRPPKEGRYLSIGDAEMLARSLGITNKDTLRRMSGLAIGVKKFTIAESAWALYPFYQLAASCRSPVRHQRISDSRNNLSTRTIDTHWSADIFRRHERGIGGYTCSMTFAESVTDFTLYKPLRDKTGAEAEGSFDWLVRMVPLLCAFSNGAQVRLVAITVDNDGAWYSGNAFDMNNAGMRAWRIWTGVVLLRSPAHTQALNPVENATRRINHLINHGLCARNLSGKVWAPMGVAASMQLNCQTIPRSSYRLRRDRTRFENLTGRRPDLSRFLAPPEAHASSDERELKRAPTWAQHGHSGAVDLYRARHVRGGVLRHRPYHLPRGSHPLHLDKPAAQRPVGGSASQ
jgi:hypothetical protein